MAENHFRVVVEYFCLLPDVLDDGVFGDGVMDLQEAFIRLFQYNIPRTLQQDRTTNKQARHFIQVVLPPVHVRACLCRQAARHACMCWGLVCKYGGLRVINRNKNPV
jgi:hypothetical protein